MKKIAKEKINAVFGKRSKEFFNSIIGVNKNVCELFEMLLERSNDPIVDQAAMFITKSMADGTTDEHGVRWMQYQIDKFTISMSLSSNEVKSDVMDRLSGYHESINIQNNRMTFSVEKLKRILDDPHDDTNETTYIRMVELYEKVKDHHTFTIQLSG